MGTQCVSRGDHLSPACNSRLRSAVGMAPWQLWAYLGKACSWINWRNRHQYASIPASIISYHISSLSQSLPNNSWTIPCHSFKMWVTRVYQGDGIARQPPSSSSCHYLAIIPGMKRIGEHRWIDDMLTSMCNLMFSRVPPRFIDSQIQGENVLLIKFDPLRYNRINRINRLEQACSAFPKLYPEKNTVEIHGEPRKPLALSSLEFRILSMRAIEASPAWGTIIPSYCLVKNGIPRSWIDMSIILSSQYVYIYYIYY